MLTYLIAPYSSIPDKDAHMRFIMTLSGQYMMRRPGHFIVSPLFNHYSLEHVPEMGSDWEFWKDYSTCLMAKVDSVLIIQMDGTNGSTGCAAEIKLARSMNKPISVWYRREGLDYIESMGENTLTPLEIFALNAEFQRTKDWKTYDSVPQHQWHLLMAG